MELIRGPTLLQGNSQGRRHSLCISMASHGGYLDDLPVQCYRFSRICRAQSVSNNLVLITRMNHGCGRTSNLERLQSNFLQNLQQQRWSKDGHCLATKPMYNHQRHRYVGTRASVELAGGMDIISNLGLDSLTFLAATVLVVPAFKGIKASPVRLSLALLTSHLLLYLFCVSPDGSCCIVIMLHSWYCFLKIMCIIHVDSAILNNFLQGN
jgi:hypothetical protein